MVRSKLLLLLQQAEWCYGTNTHHLLARRPERVPDHASQIMPR